MKGKLKKINLKTLLGKVKLVPEMITNMSGKTKSNIIKAVSGVGLAGVLIAGAAPSLNQNTDAVLPPTENTQDQDAEAEVSDDAEEEDNLEFSFLSDELKITDIDMESILGQRVAEEVAQASEGMAPVEGIGVDESGKPLTKEEIHQAEERIDGNYFIAPDGTPWVSEEEYNKYIAGQNGTGEEVVSTDTTTTTGQSYFIAPDGSFWESEEQYNEYINGVNNTPEENTPSTTGNGDNNNNNDNNNQNNDSTYRAPDGTFWDSEKDYLDYIAQGQNANNDDYFIAPDGSFWESEEQYNSYISGLTSGQTGNDEVTDDNNTSNNDTGYFAPDGSYWASEQDYIDYINSLNNTNNNNDNNDNQNQDTNEDNNENENNSSNDYFVAPDGSVWASEQDYNDYMSSLTNDSEKTM